MTVFAALVTANTLWERRTPATPEQARWRYKRDGVLMIVACTLLAVIDIASTAYLDKTGRYYLLFHSMLFTSGGFIGFFHLRTAASISSAILLVSVLWIVMTCDDVESLALTSTMLIHCSIVFTSMIKHDHDFCTLVESRAEMQALNAENARLARTDTLTGLKNRREFFSTLNQRLTAAKRGETCTIGIIDLDGFKPINDTYGHQTGDRVLAVIAERLTQDPSWPIEVFRLGGDEFALIINSPAEDAERIGSEIIAAISRRIVLGELHLEVGCSVGVASYPETAATASELYEAADFALYQVKRAGRGRIEVFSAAHRAQQTARTELERTLREADHEAEFYPVFQPIVDTRNGQTLAFECLARWESPALGTIPPGYFVPIAEKSGLSSVIALTILRKGLASALGWPAHVQISVNLSAEDVTSPTMAEALIATITSSGIDPRRVTFELTETALLNDLETARRFMLKLREAGCHLALDDFGTGYSSLSHVQQLPLDHLKIDRSFIKDITSNVTSQSIVRSLMVLCDGINIACVVEGVETQDQVETLQALGCTLLQGYFYARPMPADATTAFVGSRTSNAA